MYCHSDGYVEYNGKMLCEHYMDKAKVAALIELGNMSYLKPTIEESFFYDRDRGDRDCGPTVKFTLHMMMRKAARSNAEYFYLFSDGEWQVSAVRREYWRTGKGEPYTELQSLCRSV